MVCGRLRRERQRIPYLPLGDPLFFAARLWFAPRRVLKRRLYYASFGSDPSKMVNRRTAPAPGR